MRKACQFIIPSFLAAVLLFGGCKSEKQLECINIDVATALKQTGKFPLSEMVSDVQIIQLDTVRDAFFGNMSGLSMSDHFFGFVCDQQKRAYLFDRSGKFIANIGRRGKGPGEFAEPVALSISPDEKFIVLGDPWQGKLLLFDMAGHFIREKVIKKDSPGWRIEVVKFADESSIYVIFRRPDYAGPDYASILKYDLDFNLTSKILPRSESDKMASEENIFFTLMPAGDSTCFWEAGKDTVYYIDRNGVARPRYHLDIKNHCYDQEKGQMKFYVPGQTDLCTKAITLTDLPGYLFATVFDNGGSRALVFDKRNFTSFAPDHPIACDTSSRESWVRTSIDNDVYGLEPLYFEQYFPERKELIALVRPGWNIETHDMTCIRQRTVKFPQIRDQLVTLTESRLGRENMAIVVMKMR